MSVKLDFFNNTASDWAKGIGAGIGAALPVLAVAVGDNHISLAEAAGVFSAFLLAGLAALGLYHSSAEVPPVVPPGVNGVHTDSEGNTING